MKGDLQNQKCVVCTWYDFNYANQEMLEALKALSVFFTENSLRTRRNLRGDIERRSLAINEEFAQIFKEVKEVRKCLIN